MTGLVSINGCLQPESSAQIPANDRFFLFGDGVYEIMSSIKGAVLDFDRHLERLREAANYSGISIPWTNDAILFDLQNLISQVPGERHAIRLIVSSGQGFSPRRGETETPKYYLFCRTNSLPIEKIEQGINIKSYLKTITTKEPTLKTNSYISTISKQSAAQAEGYDEVCWENTEGELLEAGFANLFLIGREGDYVEIATPPVSSGILSGITRRRIIELLHNANIKVTERIIPKIEIARFDEGFLSSSLQGLVPINRFNTHKLHSTRKNSVFRDILRLYSAWEQSQSIASESFSQTFN